VNTTDLTDTQPQFNLVPQSVDEAMRMADMLAESSIVPKDFQGRPGNVFVAIQWGMELGLKPMQALQNIGVINGRPALWGDAVLALVLSSPSCVDVIETYEGDGDDYAAVCVAKRKGKEDKVGRFSFKDAKKAGLLSKQGPWQQYPERMLKMRARAFALRDQFADVLKGIPVAEEMLDAPVSRDMGRAEEVSRPAPSRTEAVREKLATKRGHTPPRPAPPPPTDAGPTVDAIIHAIEAATTSHELTKALEPVTRLASDADKTRARAAYAAKLKSEKERAAASATNDTEGDLDGDQVSYAEVADRLNNADGIEALDAVADLIRAVKDSEQSDELTTLYHAKRQSLLNAGGK
jgi:hypothetical protein